MHRFGTTIRRARKSRAWTTDLVARRLGTNKSYVSSMETGNVNPPSPALTLKIASLFDLDATELLLLAVSEKAPKLVRAELRRRLFGVGRRTANAKQSLVELKRRKRIVSKIERLRLAFDELLEEVRSALLDRS